METTSFECHDKVTLLNHENSHISIKKQTMIKIFEQLNTLMSFRLKEKQMKLNGQHKASPKPTPPAFLDRDLSTI